MVWRCIKVSGMGAINAEVYSERLMFPSCNWSPQFLQVRRWIKEEWARLCVNFLIGVAQKFKFPMYFLKKKK